MKEKQEIPMAGGVVTSSKVPRLDLIPTEFLVRTAGRFETGIERKGDKAWNALSANQSCLTNREFLLERVAHGIKHPLNIRDKILAGKPLDEGDDDAGAVAWTAALYCCATKALAEAKPPENCSACGGAGIYLRRDGLEHFEPCPACSGRGKKGGHA